MRGSLIAAFAAAAVLAGVGCAKDDYYQQSQAYKDKTKKADAQASEKRMAAVAGYHEFEHDGRTYVVSSEAMAAKVKAGQEMPYQVTRIIGGKTVKFEASKESSAMDSKLMTEYQARHATGGGGQASN